MQALGSLAWLDRLWRIASITIKLQRASSLHQSDEDDDYCEYQQNMDEPAYCIGSDQAQCPKDDKNDGNRFEHDISPFLRLNLLKFLRSLRHTISVFDVDHYKKEM